MIVVIGSINLDLIANVDRLPEPGETIAGSAFSTSPGGKGANQALAAARAGAPVALVGVAGNDSFRDQALALLEQSDADLSHVAEVEDTTGIAIIMVEKSGENVIAVVPGANAHLTSAMVDAAPITNGDIVLLQHEIPQDLVAHAIDICRNQGAVSILNTAPYRAESAGLLGAVDYVIANETEFDLYAAQLGLSGDTREARIEDYAERFDNTLIVTLGAAGVVAISGDVQIELPAPKIEPIDTTGAGDTFCGYFAASLATGSPLDDALARAVRAGSLTCLQPGAQPAIPVASQVDAP
ncbi:ribokinase [Limoniibacter endophyticus]|uniref:Ribokinase n=1 Tax=Limoniibacter endophyticus TaxID=1565040 RepID=A0A8J3DH57_9HYPH|nr:ribokinase [Limoniibacter endophyticus]GHC66591.1 ribokinase [Limoniibacter endophyticus]